MIHIGPWQLTSPAFVAPMAGVTDRPYRRLCKALGAEYAVTEMAASNPRLWDTVKTARRLDHTGEPDPIAVQITGSDPTMMAEAALFNIDKGAHIIDINMGCPVKKVCNVLSGSALLKDEDLVARIVEKVVNACQAHQVPVTLKTRTGWDHNSKHAVRVAKRAEEAGIAAFTLHGRTRSDLYQGQAEYDTIRAVKAALRIPVIANGDIDSPQKAKFVLDYTGADAVMIGRAAQGRPWIFREINHFLTYQRFLDPPTYGEMKHVLLEHLQDHYDFYGEFIGVRSARKHIGWYLADTPNANDWLSRINQIECTTQQLQAVSRWFDQHDPNAFLVPIAFTEKLMSNSNPLEQAVRDSLERYFADLGDSPPRDILAMVINYVERPILEIALEKTNGNQSKAAEVLGITRSTLRKKLLAHRIQP